MLSSSSYMTLIVGENDSIVRGMPLLPNSTADDVIRALGLQGDWELHVLNGVDHVVHHSDCVLLAAPQDEEVLAILIQKRRNKNAARLWQVEPEEKVLIRA